MFGWGLAGLALGWLAFVLWHKIEGPAWFKDRLKLRLVLGLILFFALLIIAIFRDAAELPAWFLWLMMYFSGPRFLAFGWGFVIGIFTATFRDEIQRRLNQIFWALLGTGEGSSWTFPVVLGVILIIGVMIILKPDILDNIESFKAGDFEAKFAERSSTIKEAQLGKVPIDQTATLDVWEDFDTFYLDEKAGRRTAAEWFGPKSASKSREAIFADQSIIFKQLWANHINPLVGSIACLRKMELREAARKDHDLTEWGATWEDFLLKLNESSNKDLVTRVLERSNALVTRIVKNTRDIGCGKLSPPKFEPTPDAMWSQLEKSRVDLSGNDSVKPDSYALTLVDPYITAAVADALNFSFDQREKAQFLTRVSRNYPDDKEMIQPGTNNLYYQLTDAKLYSESLWPLKQMIEELERATDGAVYIISQTADRLRKDPSIGDKADRVTDAYNRNLFLFFIRALEIYNQRVLAGEPLSDFHKQNWTQAFSQLNAFLYAQSKFPTPSFGDLPTTRVDSDTAKRWPMANLDAHMFFNAYVAAGLSAILRQREGRVQSAESCMAANYYVKRAEDEIANLGLNSALQERAQQYVFAVDNVVRGACKQSPRRN